MKILRVLLILCSVLTTVAARQDILVDFSSDTDAVREWSITTSPGMKFAGNTELVQFVTHPGEQGLDPEKLYLTIQSEVISASKNDYIKIEPANPLEPPILKNVGTIKSFTIKIKTEKPEPINIGIIIEKSDGSEEVYYFPQPLNFHGLRRLTWVNPFYIRQVIKQELQPPAVYTEGFMSHISLKGLVLIPAEELTPGESIKVVIDTISVTYDQARLK